MIPAELGETMRNEAILLLGCFHYEAAAELQSLAYKNFLARAARAWAKVRPEGGLPQIDEEPRGRATYGFALEAWARKDLGHPPLHPAYVTPAVAEAYTRMTDEQIEIMVGDAKGFDATREALYTPHMEWPTPETERQAMAQKAEADSRFSPSEADIRASVERLRR